MAYNLDDDNLLGEGTFGRVFAIDDTTAVKRVFVQGKKALRQMTLAEIHMMIGFKLYVLYFCLFSLCIDLVIVKAWSC